MSRVLFLGNQKFDLDSLRRKKLICSLIFLSLDQYFIVISNGTLAGRTHIMSKQLLYIQDAGSIRYIIMLYYTWESGLDLI